MAWQRYAFLAESTFCVSLFRDKFPENFGQFVISQNILEIELERVSYLVYSAPYSLLLN
jgi:hypothetical protein